jgi:serine acetyltransferase
MFLFSREMICNGMSGNFIFNERKKTGILIDIIYYFQYPLFWLMSIPCRIPIVSELCGFFAINWTRGILGFILRGVYWKIKFGRMGIDVFIDRGFTAYNFTKNIIIENTVHLDTNVTISCSKDGYLKIGNRVYVGCNSFINCRPFVELGDDVVIGNNCDVMGGEALLLKDDQMRPPCSLSRGHHDHFRGVVFERFSAMSPQSMIFPNPTLRTPPYEEIKGEVRIGFASLIGANSFVTESIGAWEVWAGSPAKKRTGFKEYVDSRSGDDKFMEYYK